MSDKDVKDSYTGSRFTVIHCEAALESLENALAGVNASKRKSLILGLILQIERLANGERMTKENFPQEGDLPKRKGQQKAKKFNALKRKPIRGYCWFSEQIQSTYFVSHYIYKDHGRLKPGDTSRVGANWRRIEEDGDER